MLITSVTETSVKHDLKSSKFEVPPKQLYQVYSNTDMFICGF